MPRPISWLPFVRAIHRNVSNATRSHYSRRQLQLLFKIQPRTAQQLFEMLPREEHAGAYLVQREGLASFLERVHQANVAGGEATVRALFAEIRTNPPRPGKRTIRMQVDHEGLPTLANLLPSFVTLQRGRCVIEFDTIEEMGAAIVGIAARIAADEEVFEADFCRERRLKAVSGRDQLAMLEVTEMLRELEELEAQRYTPAHRNITAPTQTSSTN